MVVRQDDVSKLVVINLCTLMLPQMEVTFINLACGDCEPITTVECFEVEFTYFHHIGIAEDDLSQVALVTGKYNVR